MKRSRQQQCAVCAQRGGGKSKMPGEYNAQIETFVPTVMVNWKARRVRLNLADYDAAKHGPIVEGPTQPPIKPGVSEPALKNPFLDGDGRRIADQHSPLHRA